jgi:hypothetical protein
MQQVHEQLGQLTRQAVRNPGPFGLWLKRVWPGQRKSSRGCAGAVEVCEVASQLLGHPDVMTVLVADMSTVAASAEIKYSQLETLAAKSRGDDFSSFAAKGAYGRVYLQKMVQLQFDLPPENLATVGQILTTESDQSVGAGRDGNSNISGTVPIAVVIYFYVPKGSYPANRR